mgnify:CR=1 FL=1
MVDPLRVDQSNLQDLLALTATTQDRSGSDDRCCGAGDEEIREVILQMSVYAGVPAALMALNEFEKFRAEDSPVLGFGDSPD